jgi:hypothetical protein
MTNRIKHCWNTIGISIANKMCEHNWVFMLPIMSCRWITSQNNLHNCVFQRSLLIMINCVVLKTFYSINSQSVNDQSGWSRFFPSIIFRGTCAKKTCEKKSKQFQECIGRHKSSRCRCFNNFVLHYFQHFFMTRWCLSELSSKRLGINQRNCVKIMFVEKNFIFDLVYL